MMKNVVFDIGGVLANYRLKEFLAEQGFDGPMIKRIVRASVMSPYWDAFDRGELTEEEVLAKFASLDPEIEDDLRRAYTSIEAMLQPQEYAVPWVRELKEQGFGVYYLSNYSKKAYDECHSTLAALELMDGGLLSFREHMTKPDPAFFQLFLERYDLKAEDCYFVDDTLANVEAARELGFVGIHFESYESARAQIMGA